MTKALSVDLVICICGLVEMEREITQFDYIRQTERMATGDDNSNNHIDIG